MSNFLRGFGRWCADHSKQIGIGLTVLGGAITITNALCSDYNRNKEMNKQINDAVTREMDRRLPSTIEQERR